MAKRAQGILLAALPQWLPWSPPLSPLPLWWASPPLLTHHSTVPRLAKPSFLALSTRPGYHLLHLPSTPLFPQHLHRVLPHLAPLPSTPLHPPGGLVGDRLRSDCSHGLGSSLHGKVPLGGSTILATPNHRFLLPRPFFCQPISPPHPALQGLALRRVPSMGSGSGFR